MHRDVKPDNIIINHSSRDLRLIDWGLADFYLPDGNFNHRVGTLQYKAPELLLSDRQYHYSIDMWSLGCVLAEMLFGRVLFPGKDGNSVMKAILEVLGSGEVEKYVERYDFKLTSSMEKVIEESEKRGFESFVTGENEHLVSREAFDLLE